MTPQLKTCLEALNTGRKILICGNGGSASQAGHFAAELVVRYRVNRAAIPCINLTADVAILTACANDFGFPYVFSRQVEAYGKPGDVLIAISTSGKSRNVQLAIEAAHAMGMATVSPPRDGRDTADIQERQMEWLHSLAKAIEEYYVTPAEAR